MALLQKAYLGSTPLFRNTSWFEDDVFTNVDQSSAVTVTADATAHVKGAWTELVASTSANSSLIYFTVTAFINGSDSSTLLDIGIGASGSESVLIADIAVGGAASTSSFRYGFSVPIQVPSGSRISARAQSLVTGGKTITVTARLIDAGDYSATPTSVDTIGVNTATSEGTNFSASNTYVELTSSTSRAYRAIVMLPNVSGNATASVVGTLTLAKGASGSEVELGSFDHEWSNAEAVGMFDGTLITSNVPSGTRLAVKITGPTANFANYGSCLIGIP